MAAMRTWAFLLLWFRMSTQEKKTGETRTHWSDRWALCLELEYGARRMRRESEVPVLPGAVAIVRIEFKRQKAVGSAWR